MNDYRVSVMYVEKLVIQIEIVRIMRKEVMRREIWYMEAG